LSGYLELRDPQGLKPLAIGVELYCERLEGSVANHPPRSAGNIGGLRAISKTYNNLGESPRCYKAFLEDLADIAPVIAITTSRAMATPR